MSDGLKCRAGVGLAKQANPKVTGQRLPLLPCTGVHRCLCGAHCGRHLHLQLPAQRALSRPGGPGPHLRPHGEWQPQRTDQGTSGSVPTRGMRRPHPGLSKKADRQDPSPGPDVWPHHSDLPLASRESHSDGGDRRYLGVPGVLFSPKESRAAGQGQN